MPPSARVSNGDQPRQQIGHDEFVTLLVRHDRRIRGFIATLLARVDDSIDEVLQEVCLVAWKKADQFRYSGTEADEEFVRWICTIARYVAMAWRRSQCKSPQLLDKELMDRLTAIQTTESSYFEERHQALMGCLQRLQFRDREMTRQRYEVGISVPELAAAYGIGVDAVYKALSRIRATLLDCVERTMRRKEYQ